MNVTFIINEDDEVQPNAGEASKLRGIVRCLLYIALNKRPDLCIAAGCLGSDGQDLKRSHMKS